MSRSSLGASAPVWLCEWWDQVDGRTLEVVDGFPCGVGAQLAVDTTLVSPVKSDAQHRSSANRSTWPEDANEATYPELVGKADGNFTRCSLRFGDHIACGRTSVAILLMHTVLPTPSIVMPLHA